MRNKKLLFRKPPIFIISSGLSVAPWPRLRGTHVFILVLPAASAAQVEAQAGLLHLSLLLSTFPPLHTSVSNIVVVFFYHRCLLRLLFIFAIFPPPLFLFCLLLQLRPVDTAELSSLPPPPLTPPPPPPPLLSGPAGACLNKTWTLSLTPSVSLFLGRRTGILRQKT